VIYNGEITLTSDTNKETELNERNQTVIGAGIAIGVGIGVAIGAAMGNIGIALGASMGIVIGVGMQQKKNADKDKSNPK